MTYSRYMCFLPRVPLIQREQERCIRMCSDSDRRPYGRECRWRWDIPHLSFQDARFQVQGVRCNSYLPLVLTPKFKLNCYKLPPPCFCCRPKYYSTSESHAVKTVRLLYLPSAPVSCCSWHPFAASFNSSKYKSVIANSDLGCFNKQSWCSMRTSHSWTMSVVSHKTVSLFMLHLVWSMLKADLSIIVLLDVKDIKFKYPNMLEQLTEKYLENLQLFPQILTKCHVPALFYCLTIWYKFLQHIRKCSSVHNKHSKVY